ncbi:DUF3168 domain-containing protein [Actinosynnema mirum]|uniref:DUF3168 domain-containing protein n=1 Tax=Actinosynnema mirum (strain ATCC 29888 / DSM 43827 / JCM 3225 / NBRC 14064 / NCIMB 13271 / NRRL B-12336 / IMRU 3971 / 101) TaxID=446462 RepID=C6WC59_ACTMD|nr:DUF3168 domain-containing protein [Actinosynnema mirum]ACU39447.1 hypothetical protein Amir_5631 [Actinosynnema mirum DSM 43827]
MAESELPWAADAVLALLRADTALVALVANRMSTRTGSSVVAGPYLTVQLPTPLGLLGGGGYRPIVQVDAWCAPAAAPDDPERVVWRVADRVRRVLDAARNVPYRSMHYSCRVIDLGPLPADTSRGPSAPVYRAMCRAEMSIHNR